MDQPINFEKSEMSSELKFCDPCLFTEMQTEALGFCLTCAEYMCKECIKEHKKVKLTRKHSVLQDLIPDNAETLREIREASTCRNHADTIVTFYCPGHSEYVCTMCCMENHRKCDDIYNILNAEAKQNDAQEIDGIGEKIKNIFQKIEEQKIRLLEEKNKIGERKNVLMEEYAAKLNELDKKCTQELNTAFSGLMIDIEKTANGCKTIEHNYHNSCEKLKAALQIQESDTGKVFCHMMYDTFKSIAEQIKVHECKGQPKLEFEENASISKLLSLGSVSIKDGERQWTDQPDCQTNQSSSNVTDTPEFDNDQCRVEIDLAVPTRSLQELCIDEVPNIVPFEKANDCCIEDMAVIDDRNVVLINSIKPYQIKLLSKDYIRVDSVHLPGKPYRICLIGPNKLAVTFSNIKLIYTCRIENNKLRFVSGLKTKHEYTGIASKDENLIGLTKRGSEVHLLDSNGTLVRICKFDATTNLCVIMRQTEGELFVAERNRILCFKTEYFQDKTRMTAHKERILTSDEKHQYGEITSIATTANNVFVCTDKGLVLQTSTQCLHDLQVIITENPHPVSICVDTKRKRIILAHKDISEIRWYGFDSKALCTCEHCLSKEIPDMF